MLRFVCSVYIGMREGSLETYPTKDFGSSHDKLLKK